jgi:hypothetical protein
VFSWGKRKRRQLNRELGSVAKMSRQAALKNNSKFFQKTLKFGRGLTLPGQTRGNPAVFSLAKNGGDKSYPKNMQFFLNNF